MGRGEEKEVPRERGRELPELHRLPRRLTLGGLQEAL